MNKPLSLVLLFIFLNFTGVMASPLKPGTAAVSSLQTAEKNNDSSIVVIPFEYKQSALYHVFTMEVMDSVIAILLKDPAVTLSIEGYTHADEGSDTISYYLSLNRALFIRDYVLGRGIDSSRIISVKGLGKSRPLYHGSNKQGIVRNCRAEIRLNYPLPAPIPVISDKDEDGIPDASDGCPDVYGEKAFNGCPNKDAVIIPFEPRQTSLNTMNYKILDSIVAILKQNPALTVSLEGHAHKIEGSRSVCESLSKERADIVKGYLLSRYIPAARIESVKSFGYQRPLNAGKTALDIILNSRTEIIMVHH